MQHKFIVCDMTITNPCGVAHFQNKACRECDRLRALTETRTESKVVTTDAVVITEEEIREKAERGEISFTNADRCRRWRMSGDVEAKREANRLRMRMKRG